MIKNRTLISCFTLLSMLFILFSAHSAFADFPVNVWVYLQGNGLGSVTTTSGYCSNLMPENFYMNYSNGSYCDALFSGQLYAEPASGGTFLGWSGCPNPNGAICTIADGANYTVYATFSSSPSQVESFSLTKQGNGTGTVTSLDGIISCGSNCTGMQNAQIPVNSYTLTAIPDPGNVFIGWNSNFIWTTSCNGSDNGYDASSTCTIPIAGDPQVTATFEKTYTVTPSAGANGSINPNTPQSVVYNKITSFTVTPNSGYYIASVTGCGGTLSGNTYTTGPITANCTVSASFTSTPPPSSAQGPAFSMPAGIFLAVAGLGIILWRRRKMNGQTEISETR